MRTISSLIAALKRRGAAIGLAAILLVAGTAANAQILSLYFKQITRDGQIYIFNSGEQYKKFQENGDMGPSPITIPEYGPNGELLISENETAIDLYNLKHDKEAYDRPLPKQPDMPKSIGWKDGKTTFEFKRAKLTLSNRVQIRHTQFQPDDNTLQSIGSFRIRRFKTAIEGWAYTKDLTFKLQLNWADTASTLEDAWINYDVFHNKAFQLKAGQFKSPYGRQELTSSGAQQFVDRSLVNGAFAPAYQIGAALSGDFGSGVFTYAVAMQNGNGRNVTVNDNGRYLYTGRLQYAPFGEVKYSESDFDTVGLKPLLAIGVQHLQTNFAGVTTGAIAFTNPTPAAPGFFSTTNNDLDRTAWSGDVTFKWNGLSLFAEYHKRNNEYEQGPVRLRTNPTVPTALAPNRFIYVRDFDERGINAQLGYFVFKRNLELAVRYATYDPNTSVDDDEQHERGGVVSWYWNKHAHKIQLDYRQLQNDLVKRTLPAGSPASAVAPNRYDEEIRLQYQLIF